MAGDMLFAGRRFSAFLFDMDGTILTSIEAAERVWTRWAIRHGLDVAKFLPTMHGSRAIDTVRRQNLADIDAVAEADWVMHAEIADIDGIRPIAGAAAFLASLPADRWAIVTSASLALAQRRLAAAGLPPPAAFITAEDVDAGKPEPDCFLLAARTLGFQAADCLVFEDAAAGIEAGERSGATVLVIRAAHPRPMDTPHVAVEDYRRLEAVVDADGSMRLRQHDVG